MKRRLRAMAGLSALLTVLTFLPACAESTPGNTDTTKDIDPSAETTQESTAPQELPELPETADYGGHSFNILCTGNWEFNDFEAKELTGEVINDEMYLRNTSIEEKYNITIHQIDESGTGANGQGTGFKLLQQSVLAGDHAYDAAEIGAYDVSVLAYNALLSNLNSFPHIDLSKSWWDQKANEDLAINGIMYYTTGDISLLDNNCTYCILFNKKMIEDYAMESPYDMVRSGTWTIDNFISMASQVSMDLNGDSKHDQNDLYGLLIWQDSMLGMISAAGEKVASVTENGIALTLNTERVLSMLEKYMSLAYDKTLTYSMYHLGDHATNMFSNNQVLFYTRYLQAVSWFRDMETDFGILPYPKYDESQDQYYTNIHAYGTSFLCVPSVVEGRERTGVILETLAYESQKTLTPAYYEKTLNGKYFRDEESAEMLDILLSTRVFDIGLYYQIGTYNERIMDLLRNYNTDFASMYAKMEKPALKLIETINAAFDDAIAKSE